MIADHKLVYGVLTAVLMVAFVGAVVVLQALLRAYTGWESQLAVVASTLVIAVLLDRPRRRVRAHIDDSLRWRKPQRRNPR